MTFPSVCRNLSRLGCVHDVAPSSSKRPSSFASFRRLRAGNRLHLLDEGRLAQVLLDRVCVVPAAHRLNTPAKEVLNPETYSLTATEFWRRPGTRSAFGRNFEIQDPASPSPRTVSCSSGWQRLVWLHTFGERMTPSGEHKGAVPTGKARCTRTVPGSPDEYPTSYSYDAEAGELQVGGSIFNPVSPEVGAPL